MEIIDLTNSPPSSPKANAPRTRTFAENTFRPKPVIQKLPVQSRCKHQAVPRPSVRQLLNPDHEQPQNLQVQNHVVHEQGSGNQTADASRKQFFIYHVRGIVTKDNWTETERRLFLMGVIKYGKGSWDKIAKEFVTTKTPEQVYRYAEVLYKHFPTTSLFAFNANKTKKLPNIMKPGEIDLNRTATDPENSSPSNAPMSRPSGSNALAPNMVLGSQASVQKSSSLEPEKSHEDRIQIFTKPLFPVEAPVPVSVEKSASLEPEKSISLRAFAEEPHPVNITLALPDHEIETDDQEKFNLDLTLGLMGT